ncbi:MAG: hypothetical protein ACO2PM_19865 [Pyrobaculum sp.]
MDVEILKRALRELVEREPSFVRDLMLDALRSDGGAAEALLELLTRHPEAKLKLAQAVAGSIAVPLNVATKDDIKAAVEELKKWTEEKFATKEDLKQYATKQDLETTVEQLKKWAEEKFATKEDLKQFATKEDLKQLATKEDLKQFATKEDLKQFATKQDLERFVTKEYFDAVIKRLEDKMATKEQIESITISVEDSGREMVQYLLEQRGYKCTAERLRLDSDYEFDIYCNAGVLTAVGEAKVRAGGRDVEKTLERAHELQRRQQEKISGKLVPVFYTLVAEPSAIQKAKELKIWLIESKREVVTLEEVLRAGGADA